MRHYLDISTGHIKEENSNLILETKGAIFNEIGLYGYPYEHGTFLTIGECEPSELIELYNKGFDDIVDIIRYCLKRGIDLIRFDCDAESVKSLKNYNW